MISNAFLGTFSSCLFGLLIFGEVGSAQDKTNVDVVVFGATPAGVAAALGAASDGCNVLLVEPTHRIGGLLTSGLSHSDFHSRESLSGAFWSFAKRVTSHYQNTYGPNSQQAKDCSGGVFAEPKVNLLVLEQWLAEKPAIRVVRNCKLKSVSVDRINSNLTSIRNISFTADGRDMQVECRVAIDASYEGDLMAQAGVSWRVGRESRKEYGESLAPEAADEQLQAYNFRFVMTKEPQNRVTPVAPKNYRREDFVGVLDALVAGKINKVFDYPRSCIFKAHTPPLPNGKYDINDVSQNIVRLSLPGKNLPWPNGNPSDRKAVFDEHERDQVGLLYFLQNDESVPEKFRSEAKEWGWCRDEFVETEHLPPQLYVREARRMVGLHVYTQHDAAHAPKDARAVFFAESIAMGDYGNNCHGTAHEGPRFGGKHTGEFYNPVPPYQIPHGVMVPREVNNLLVPVAASSTHVGFCALRLEPIWMSLGQAAGHAAAQSIQHNTSVQQTAIKALQHRLHSVGAATIYVSDVLPDHPDFVAVQWWGAQGGLHGLAPMPNKPGQRGRNLHGQYYEANPEHTANLDVPLDDPTLRRWKAIAILSGLNEDQLPSSNQSMTRGDFVRSIYQSADRMGLVSSRATVPRLHREGLPNQHAPGEVDILELVHRVVPDPSTLPGIVVDDCDAVLEGKWQYSTHTPPYVGRGYLHDMKEDKGAKSATYIPDLPRTGIYEVRVSHCYNIRRATNTQIVIRHADGETSLNINQQVKPEHAELFRSLGRYRFVAGTSGWVRVVNAGDSGKVAIADAVQFLPAY